MALTSFLGGTEGIVPFTKCVCPFGIGISASVSVYLGYHQLPCPAWSLQPGEAFPEGAEPGPAPHGALSLADLPVSALPTACCRQSPPRSLTPGTSGPGTASPSPTCAAALEGPWHGLPLPPSTRQPR